MKTDIVALPKSQIARLKGTTGIRSSAGNRFLAEPLRQMKVHACNKASITVKFLNVLSNSRFQNPMLIWRCRKPQQDLQDLQDEQDEESPVGERKSLILSILLIL